MRRILLCSIRSASRYAGAKRVMSAGCAGLPEELGPGLAVQAGRASVQRTSGWPTGARAIVKKPYRRRSLRMPTKATLAGR